VRSRSSTSAKPTYDEFDYERHGDHGSAARDFKELRGYISPEERTQEDSATLSRYLALLPCKVVEFVSERIVARRLAIRTELSWRNSYSVGNTSVPT